MVINSSKATPACPAIGGLALPAASLPGYEVPRLCNLREGRRGPTNQPKSTVTINLLYNKAYLIIHLTCLPGCFLPHQLHLTKPSPQFYTPGSPHTTLLYSIRPALRPATKIGLEEEEEVQRKNGGRGFKKYLLHRRLETFKSDRWDDRPHTLVFRVSSISCLPFCPCLYLPR